MRIHNINKFLLLHIGWSFLLLGLFMTLLQVVWSEKMFPLDMAILTISVIFQLIGRNEPLFFSVKKLKEEEKHD
jgi:hypothetical protein